MARARIKLSFPTLKQISNKEWRDMNDHIIKVWHFERSGKGVKPVEGECDPNDPNHIPISKVLRRSFR